MKLLLTGSSGFIGSHLTPRLEHQFDVHHLKNDLLDFDAVAQEIQQVSPDIVVHLAARTEVEKSFYEQITFSQINYTGSVNLIEAVAKLNKPCYFVFASTMEVYGWQPVSDDIKQGRIPSVLPVFDETTPVNPNAPYAVAKYGVEKYLEYAQRAYGLDYAIIRQTNSYGRKDNNFFVTEQIIWQMLQGDVCNLGYGEPFRNFIYIDDLLDAWETVISNKDKCANNLFTIGPPNAVQITEHANNIAKELGWTGTINWNTKPKRHGEIYILNSGHDKLTTLTGWAPKVSYSEGIKKTVNFWKKKKNSKNIHEEILKTFSLINDLDYPEDSIYDMADVLSQFDGHTNESWKKTEQYKQWANDPEKIIETWRNCSSYMIQLFEKNK